MKIGALTAAWAADPLEKVLDFFAENGLQAVEIGTGNFPPNSHCDPDKLLADPKAAKRFKDAVESRGMVISALSCHGNPLHPNAKTAKKHHAVFVSTVQLAKKIGVTEINGFSGLPAGAPGDKTPNWVVAPWPDEHLAALEYQWRVAVEYWKEQNKLLDKHGVNMCFEMHPNFLVYNPETLIKLRQVCGKRMCCNFDPSHLFWQGIDVPSAIRWLSEHGEVIKHVHAKDSLVYTWNSKVNGVLDTKHYGDEMKRAWIFRTVGYGHDDAVWKDIISTLRMVGYDGALSIEHEDSLMSNDEGFLKALAFLKEATIFQARSAMTWA